MLTRIKQFRRKHREARWRTLHRRLHVLSETLRGVDEAVWPDEAERLTVERNRTRRQIQTIESKLQES